MPIRASIASGLHCVLTEGGSSAETFSRPLDVTWPAVPEELTDMVEPFTILKFFAVEGPPALAIAQSPFLCPDALCGEVYAYLPWIPAPQLQYESSHRRPIPQLQVRVRGVFLVCMAKNGPASAAALDHATTNESCASEAQNMDVLDLWEQSTAHASRSDSAWPMKCSLQPAECRRLWLRCLGRVECYLHVQFGWERILQNLGAETRRPAEIARFSHHLQCQGVAFLALIIGHQWSVRPV